MEAISIFIRPHEEISRAIEEAIQTQAIKAWPMSLKSGEYLFREGENIRQTFYISRGLVRLSSNNIDGRSKTVFFHKAGTLIGFQWLNQGNERKPSILNARATSTCELFAIDGKSFFDYMRGNGDLSYWMCEYLFKMLSLQAREAVNASVYPVLQRFAALVLALTRELGSLQAPAIVPFSNAELAEMLGVHPNSIANAITSLRKSDCVEKQRSFLVVTDFRKLKNVAESLIDSDGIPSHE